MLEFARTCVGILLVVSIVAVAAGSTRAFRSGDKVGRMLGLSPLLILASGIVIVPFVGGYVIANTIGPSPALEQALSAFIVILILVAGVRGVMLFRRYRPGRDRSNDRAIERARPSRHADS